MMRRLVSLSMFALGPVLGCGAEEAPPAADTNGPRSTLRFVAEAVSATSNVKDCPTPGLPSTLDSYALTATGRAWSPGATGRGVATNLSVTASPPFERNVPLPLTARNAGQVQQARSAGDVPAFRVTFAQGDSQWEIATTEIVRGEMAVLDLDRASGATFRVHVVLDLSTGETIDVTLAAPLALAACVAAG